MDFMFWGFFFPLKQNDSSRNHCSISEVFSPVVLLASKGAAQCDQRLLELHSLQAALIFLSSIENIEAGFAQLASFIFGRAGVALGAPGTQIS